MIIILKVVKRTSTCILFDRSRDPPPFFTIITTMITSTTMTTATFLDYKQKAVESGYDIDDDQQ